MLKSSTHGSLQNGVLGIENKLERNTINQWTQNLHMFMEKPSRHLAAEQNNGPLCHNDFFLKKKNSQPHFEEMVLSSQPILLRSGARMTVERMKTHTNM